MVRIVNICTNPLEITSLAPEDRAITLKELLNELGDTRKVSLSLVVGEDGREYGIIRPRG